MTHLNLTDCYFASNFSSEISHLSKLVSLDLSWNFDMRIETPSLKRLIQNLTHLNELVLDFVNMSSVRPNSFMNLSSALTSLRLCYCGLKGRFPDNIFHLPNLQLLYVCGNYNLTDLSKNQINGSIPTWLLEVKTDSLSYLNLSYNSLARIGNLPWKNLQVLDLHSNLLEEPLPVPPLHTYFFSVSRNNLTREIPLLICNLSSLHYLDLSYNRLSNKIPPCLGNLSNHLIDLDLQSNNLHGTIPSTFAKGCYLRSLKLNGNRLEGSLPQSLVHCRKLEVLDFGNNKINGTFPLWLENLPKLQVLILRTNNFHGAIGNPKYKFPFPNLRIIDLSHNEFHGLLRTNFFKYLKAMKNSNADKGGLKYMGDRYYQDFVIVAMKGIFIHLVKIQSLFTTIDFKGEIPKAIEELQSLKGLNFSHNNLTGHMPPSLGKLTNLEWIDLSSNKLIGEIPIQLADLTSLAVLNLSKNHLFGQIPQGKQFNTFTNDSYNGNLGLCGFPMTKFCGNDEGQQLLPSSTTQEDDFKFENGFN
ncbi:receptor-like protein 43 [Quercus lobata]|uniref:receptor-like protein 43 n=1 Tax=Quercus lobata TaxID=97700 RepID=UPI0012459A46|nr:receptor-like protein 43 [Quercus lobata]